MTAGRGIVHSEIPGKKAGEVRGLQLWVNLKHSDKMVAPRYQEKKAKDIPRSEVNGVKVSVIAGECMGVKSPVQTLTPAYYFDFSVDPAAHFTQEVPVGWNCAVYILDGKKDCFFAAFSFQINVF